MSTTDDGSPFGPSEPPSTDANQPQCEADLAGRRSLHGTLGLVLALNQDFQHHGSLDARLDLLHIALAALRAPSPTRGDGHAEAPAPERPVAEDDDEATAVMLAMWARALLGATELPVTAEGDEAVLHLF